MLASEFISMRFSPLAHPSRSTVRNVRAYPAARTVCVIVRCSATPMVNEPSAAEVTRPLSVVVRIRRRLAPSAIAVAISTKPPVILSHVDLEHRPSGLR